MNYLGAQLLFHRYKDGTIGVLHFPVNKINNDSMEMLIIIKISISVRGSRIG